MRVALLFVAMMFAQTLWAQTNTQMTYTGRLYDAGGAAHGGQTVYLRTEVLRDNTCYLFRRDASTTTDGDGNFSLDIRAGLSGQAFIGGPDLRTLLSTTHSSALTCYQQDGTVAGSFVPSASGIQSREIVISISTDGGTSWEIVDTQVLNPYYQAQDSERFGGKLPSGYLTTGTVSQSTLDNFFTGSNFSSLQSYSSGGALTSSLAPAAGTDVVNKTYSDSYIGGQATSGLSTLGAGQTGYVLSWDGSKWVATSASTTDNTKLPLAGGTLTGDLSGTSASFSGSLGVSQLYNTRYVTMASSGYLLLSNNTTDPSLAATYKGALWYNSVSDKVMLRTSSGTVGVLTDSDFNMSNVTRGTLSVSHGGTGLGTPLTPYALLTANMTGTAFEQRTCAMGEALVWNGATGWTCQAAGTGSVTNVTLEASNIFNVTNNSVTTAGTIGLLLAPQPPNIVLAAPTGGTGTPSFRYLENSDIPGLDASKLVSGLVPASRGGTGINGSAAAAGTLLIGNGAGFSLNTLTAGTGISIANAAGGITISSSLAGGTVTNVGLTAPTSVFTLTGSPVTGAGTMAMSFASQGAATVFAAPTSAAGVPSFRSLAATDLPILAGTGVTLSTSAGSLVVSATASTGVVTHQFEDSVGGNLVAVGKSILVNGATGNEPAASLHVNGTQATSSANLIVTQPALAMGESNSIHIGTDEVIGARLSYVRGGVPYLNFGINDGNTSAMAIMQTGEVGIGTTAPNALLDVSGNMYIGPASGGMWISADDTGSSTNASFMARRFNADWTFQTSQARMAAQIMHANHDNNFILYDKDTATTSGSIGVLLSSNGLSYLLGTIGIGTRSPGSALDVVGSIRADQVCDRAGNNCKVISSGWTGAGTVTSVGLTAPTSVFTTGSAITGAGNLSLTFNSQTAGQVLASPTGAAGVPSFRALVASDIPGLDASKIISGSLGTAFGGSPWIDGSNGLYYSAKKVGIGAEPTVGSGVLTLTATSGDAFLDVTSTAASTNAGIALTSRNASTANPTTSIIQDTGGNLRVATGGLTGMSLSPAGKLMARQGSLEDVANVSLDLISTGTTGTTGINMTSRFSGTPYTSNIYTDTNGALVNRLNTNVRSVLTPTGEFEVVNPNSSTAEFPAYIVKNYSGSTMGFPSFMSLAARGTETVPTATQSGDTIGAMIFNGYGTSHVEGASITALATANWTGASRPATLQFSTSNTSGTSTTRMVIRPDGAVGIGTLNPAYLLQVNGTAGVSSLCIAGDCRTAWPAAGGAGTVTSIEAGTGLVGGIITGTGTISLSTTGVTAGVVGNANYIPQITNDVYGRITSVGSVAVAIPATSIGISAPTSVFTVTGSPAANNGTLSLGLASQSAATVFAAPTGVGGIPSFRTLAATDIPSLDASKLTSGVLEIARGGTGLNTTPANGQILIGNGTGYALNTLQAGTGVTINNAAGVITIGSTIGASQWTTDSAGISFATGSVAIGTTTHRENLDVSGTGNVGIGVVSSSLNGNAYLYLRGKNGGVENSTSVSSDYSGNMQLMASTGAAIRLGDQVDQDQFVFQMASGRLGIGTVNPNAPLDVVGAIRADQICARDGSNCKSIASGWSGGTVTSVVAGTGLTGGTITGIGTLSLATTGVAAGVVGNANYIPQITNDIYGRITTVGSVAVAIPTLSATDIPSLDASKITTGQLPVSRGGTGLGANPASGQVLIGNGTGFTLSSLTASTGINIVGAAGSITISNTGGDFKADGTVNMTGVLRVVNGSSASPAIQFAADANTGLYRVSEDVVGFSSGGTQSFTITGASTASMYQGLLRMGSGAANLPAYSFDGDTTIGMFRPASGVVAFSTGSSERMRIDASGNVGIGTTAVSAKLEVLGDAKISGVVTATSFTSTSDERFKKEIEIMPGLEAVHKLRGVSYKWRANGEGDAGVIAQEVERVFPNAVRTDANGFKSVKYNYLLAPLIEAVKELDVRCEARSNELEARIRELEDENTKLIDRQKQLEERLLRLERAAGLGE